MHRYNRNILGSLVSAGDQSLALHIYGPILLSGNIVSK